MKMFSAGGLLFGIGALTVILIASACAESTDPGDRTPLPLTPVQGFLIRESYPHDARAFTQGLLYHEGNLYESTGQYGQSTVRRVDLETGEVLARHDLSPRFFGEGLALIGDRLYQVTWRENQGFIYDRETLDQVGVFSYPTAEGWGLTTDGDRLILSAGTDVLVFLDPVDFREIRRVQVTDRGSPVFGLNELEYVEGEIYANVWRSHRLARIDPASGEVRAWIDLANLLPAGTCAGPVDVLNGIAYDEERDRLFVTGKYWCRLFDITIVEPAGN